MQTGSAVCSFCSCICQVASDRRQRSDLQVSTSQVTSSYYQTDQWPIKGRGRTCRPISASGAWPQRGVWQMWRHI